MLNDPYPSGAALRCEARLDEMLAEQERAQRQFHAALLAFVKVFDGLHFPICSPVQGFDTQAINSTLADLMIPQHPSDVDIGYRLRAMLDEEAYHV